MIAEGEFTKEKLTIPDSTVEMNWYQERRFVRTYTGDLDASGEAINFSSTAREHGALGLVSLEFVSGS